MKMNGVRYRDSFLQISDHELDFLNVGSIEKFTYIRGPGNNIVQEFTICLTDSGEAHLRRVFTILDFF